MQPNYPDLIVVTFAGLAIFAAALIAAAMIGRTVEWLMQEYRWYKRRQRIKDTSLFASTHRLNRLHRRLHKRRHW